MPALTTWMLLTAIALMPMPGLEPSRRIDVDCESELALERALARAEQMDEVDIYLHGLCKGHFVIATDGVTLRGATPESGIELPTGGTSRLPVLEVVDAQANLRGMVVRGAGVGVLVRGWEAEVLLYEVDVHDQSDVGLVASRGARVRMIDTTVRDGLTGIVVQSRSYANLQNVVVSNQLYAGVVVVDGSFAALNDTTIEDNQLGGMLVDNRSDTNVVGGVFRENGGVHVSATDWSSVNLLYDVTIGSESDTTRFALGVNRNATIASFTTPVIHGDVSALVGGSIRLGNTILNGDLTAVQFSNAHVRDAEITGVVVCVDGSDVICSQTTAAGAFGCPSSTCGPSTTEAAGRGPTAAEFPVIEVPRFGKPGSGLTLQHQPQDPARDDVEK